MKTFTHCAEKKAKQILNLLQGYTKGIRFTAMLMLLVVGTSNAWAYNFYSPHIYFNNADLNWNPAMLFVGHDSYSQGYNQTKNPIDNTKLVYFHPTASWSDQKYFTIGNSQNWGAESNGFYNRVNYLTHIGIQRNYDFNSNNTYYVTGSVSSSISVDYKSNDTNEGYKSIPTYDAKQAAKVRDINSGTYTNISGTFPATLKIKGTYLSGWQASTRSEISGTKSTDSNKYGTVVTGLVTHSYSDLSDDYQFDGWIKGSGTSITSTDATYSYNITAATTVYACFTKKYAVTFGTSGNGSITATADGNNIDSETKVVGGSKIVFTATPATGYQIEGWYSDAACTSSLSNGTNTTYTISSLTAATTVYVKFKANTYTVTLDPQNGESTNTVTATYGSAMPSITVPTRTGYTFGGYYTEANGGGTQYYKADGTSAKNWDKTSATTLYAKWTENTYTVTINNDGHGTTSPSGEQTVGQVTSTTITATPSTGYQFHSWTCEGGVVKVSESNTTEQGSITITATATGTVTANFEPIPETKYDVEIIAGANGSVNPSGTQQVGESGIDIEATANDNYQFSQWTTTGGATVADAYSASTTVTATAAGTVTANFTEIMRTITVTCNASHGTVSPSSTTAGVVTPSGDITATPKTGYEFVNWTATTGITLANANSATTTITQATADGTVTANFQEITHTIQIGIEAGQESWGSVSPTSISVGQHTASANITATAKTSVGYVFDHWEISDGITIASGDVNSATIQIKATQEGSLTAHFRGENRLQNVYLMVNSDNPADPNWQFYKLPGESGNTVTLTKTITKSDYHSNGYKFGFQIYHSDWGDKWWKNSTDGEYKMDAHSCTNWGFNTKEGDKYTYVDLNVSGEYTFTLTDANSSSNQKLSITYPDKSFIEGNFATAWDEDAYPLTENEDIQSVTINITSKTDVEFRLVSHGKLFGTSTQILVGANSQTLSAKNMEDNGAVMTIGAYVEGDYTFSYNKSTKILTVEYPSVNQLQVYSAAPAHDAVKQNWDWDINGNEYTKTLSLNANTNYTFKAVVNSVFYGRTHTITRAESSSTLYDTGGNVTLTTDVAGNYTFTFNSSNNKLTVTYPTAYTVSYSQQPTAAADAPTTSPSVESGKYVAANTSVTFTAKDANNGYTWKGWYDNNAGTGTALSSNQEYNTSISANTTIYAVYTENTYQVTIDADPAEAAATLTSSPQSVGIEAVNISTTANFTYKFDNWTATDGITIADANNESTTITATKAGTVTAHFTELQPTTVYLKPNDNWKQANARFAIHYWADGQPAGWVDMEDVGCNRDYFEGTIPAGYTEFLFARMNPDNTNNEWDAGIDWNKTGNLTIPADGKNLYSINSDSWNTGSWTTYTTPTYDVTINITGKGSVTIGGETYESTSEGTTTLTIEDLDVNTEKNVTAITPADRWEYQNNATIKIGNNDQATLACQDYTICGPTTINITFKQVQCLVSFNLNLPEGAEHIGIGEQIVTKGDTATEPATRTINGYMFGGWYTEAECTNKYDFSTPVTKDITLYARWAPYEECIFFKDNLNWDNIYIYTFSDNVWHNGDNNDDPNDDKGVQPKVNRIEYGKMTQIGYTDIYYYALTNLEGFNHIAFSDHDMHDYKDYFHNHSGIYRSDRSDKMQLFIPQKDQTPKKRNETLYYSSGLWMKYNSTYSGYDWSGQTAGNDWSHTQFTTDVAGGYSFTAEVFLNFDTNYEFKIWNINKDWFGNGGTMNQDNCTNWHFKTEDGSNAKITPTITGDYVFTVYLGDGKVMISLDYPLSVGDYRLAYQDNTHPFHPGHYIKKRSTIAEQRDTVSFFVHHDQSPKIYLQQCTAITEGVPTWQTKTTYTELGEAVSSTTVYNFILKQTNSGNTHAHSVETGETHLYTGEFYIRTDAASGGWKSFRQEGNKMTFSSYAQQNEHFDHYFCEWILAKENVKFTIANDYSYCISDTLDNDEIIEHDDVSIGCLPVDANVRFSWNSANNEIHRAYIAGSSYVADRFLVLEGNEDLKDDEGNPLPAGEDNGSDPRYGLNEHEEVFGDMGNWIYQVDVTANVQTKAKLTALYNGAVQYFKGKEGDKDDAKIALLKSTATDTYKIRLIYDFKTNHLVSGWLIENDTVEEKNAVLGANMMIIRHNQEPAEQLNFDPNYRTLTDVGIAYGVMTFDKYFLNNRDNTGNPLDESNSNYKSENERKFYWISFPFDVKISDVFGFGEYGDQWIMEYYDGAERAAKGWWAETETFWKYITNKNYTLRKGQGYVLCLNLNKMNFESNIFQHTDNVSLYFPSTDSLHTITGVPIDYTAPNHTCTIERDNRNIYDSHWNLIGVPGFADIVINDEIGDHLYKENPLLQDSVSFYYEYLPATNKYHTQTNTETFQTMYSYMVQYTGTISWSTPEFGAPALMAQRAGAMPDKYSLRLVLNQNGTEQDQTFVEMHEERATTAFDMNRDLAKMMNSGANIYTLTTEPAIMVAGNAIPMEATTVPVGVQVATAGEYTFRMPDGTDGISAILVDYQTGERTDMLLDEYTVTLNAGTCNDRFALILDPQRSATSVENINGESGEAANSNEATGAEKFIIDGKLIIRTADGIFDAQGHRL